MKFSDQELKVLGAVELRGRATTQELSAITKLPQHTVGYTLRRLQSRSIIGGIKPSINSYPWGVCHYGFFCRLARSDQRTKSKVERAVREESFIAWCAEVGGSYHYVITIAASDPISAHRVFEEVRRVIAVEFSVSMAVRLRVESYGRKYLYPQINRGEPLWYGGVLGREMLDLEDVKILKALQGGSSGTAAEASRTTGISLSTVVRRIHSLEKRSIITGFYREIEPLSLGVQAFNVHLRNVSHHAKDSIGRILAFSRKHPNIVHAIHTMGAWDFELAVEAPEIRAVTRMLDELSSWLSMPIDAEIVPVFEYLKFKPV